MIIDRKEKLTALRFLSQIPQGTWFGVRALPPEAFNYLLHGETMTEAPWLGFDIDEPVSRVRWYMKTQDPLELCRQIIESPLFNQSEGVQVIIKKLRAGVWDIEKGMEILYYLP